MVVLLFLGLRFVWGVEEMVGPVDCESGSGDEQLLANNREGMMQCKLLY